MLKRTACDFGGLRGVYGISLLQLPEMQRMTIGERRGESRVEC
jgi:hypothetical protein